MKYWITILIIFFSLISILCSKNVAVANNNPVDIIENTTAISTQEYTPMNISDLLENPVYDEEVQIYGLVSYLGMIDCTCFELISGGETIKVWFDMMVEDNHTQRPPVSIDHIQNDDVVLVTGELKSAGNYRSQNDFWASSIEIFESDDFSRMFTETVEVVISPDLDLDWYVDGYAWLMNAVNTENNEIYQIPASDIEGFIFDPGYTYHLSISVHDMQEEFNNTPMDEDIRQEILALEVPAPRYEYKLIEVISQEPVTADQRFTLTLKRPKDLMYYGRSGVLDSTAFQVHGKYFQCVDEDLMTQIAERLEMDETDLAIEYSFQPDLSGPFIVHRIME